MRKSTLVALAAALLLAAGVAVAAGANGSNPIHGCIGRHGSLTVLTHGTTCGPHQKAIVWNKQGPMGPVGNTGPKGDAGVTGPTGPSFGDTAFVTFANAGVCQDALIAQLPITVSTPSRIFTSVTGIYYDNGTGLDMALFRIELQDASGTTTVATLQTLGQDVAPNADASMSTQGVLRTGPDPQSPGTAFVAQPGTYKLEWMAQGGTSCLVSGHPNIFDGSLTYMLLGNTP
jgi:hypothetical protein